MVNGSRGDGGAPGPRRGRVPKGGGEAPTRGRPSGGEVGRPPVRGRAPQADREQPARADGQRGSRPDGQRKPRRPVRDPSADPLEIPDDVVASDLDRAARGRLRTLSKDNADGVARHLVMAGRLLEDDPELALAHALEAVRRAGRVDVVREAAGIAAYRAGRYADALRELRAARRLNGSDQHVPLIVDCERGLGRPERALAVAQEHQGTLAQEVELELAIVVSGARMDLGQPDAALAALSTPVVRAATGSAAWRAAEARVAVLAALGRHAEADALAAELAVDPSGPEDDEEVVVVDLEDEDTVDEAGGSGTVDEAGGMDAVDEVGGKGPPGGRDVPEIGRASCRERV